MFLIGFGFRDKLFSGGYRVKGVFGFRHMGFKVQGLVWSFRERV